MPQIEFDTSVGSHLPPEWSPAERLEYLLRSKATAIQLLRAERERLKHCRTENVQLKAAVAAMAELNCSMRALLDLVAGCPRCDSCRRTVVEFYADLEEDAAILGPAKPSP